jgi:peroxiredoxin
MCCADLWLIRFSPTCSSQVPSYVSSINEFKSKGVDDVYVVSVNDMFVMKAWGQKLEAEAGENQGKVKYGKLPTSDTTMLSGIELTWSQLAGDDAGKLAAALGLVLDAQAIFGTARLQRGAIVIENGKVLSVAVEPSPAEGKSRLIRHEAKMLIIRAVTTSHADEVLKSL